MRFRVALSRALRLKCPQCGQANIAHGWLSTTPSCSACDADLTVESGYFLGAIYFNYGATILIVLSAAIPLIFVAGLPMIPVVTAASVFSVAFPLWFFRYARSLWLAMDHYYHVRRRRSAEHSTSSRAERVRPESDGNSNIGCICPLCHRRFQVSSSLAHTWGHCPDCYGDVLLVPTMRAEVGMDASNETQASMTQGHRELSPLET